MTSISGFTWKEAFCKGFCVRIDLLCKFSASLPDLVHIFFTKCHTALDQSSKSTRILHEVVLSKLDFSIQNQS